MIRNLPHSSISPTSPLWIQPSSSTVSRVDSSSNKGLDVRSEHRASMPHHTFIILAEAIVSSFAYFAARKRLVSSIVPHMRHVHEFDFVAWLRRSYRPTGGSVAGPDSGTCAAIFCHPISDKDDIIITTWFEILSNINIP